MKHNTDVIRACLENPRLRDAGPARQVRLEVRESLRSGAATVPCNGCTACCRMSGPIALLPHEAEILPHYVDDDGMPCLPKQGDGVTCSFLVDGECGIYEDRPWVCRQYDCRIYALSTLYALELLQVPGYVPFSVSTPTREDRIDHVSCMLAEVELRRLFLLADNISRLAVVFAPGFRNHAIEVVKQWEQSRRPAHEKGKKAATHTPTPAMSLEEALTDYLRTTHIDWTLLDQAIDRSEFGGLETHAQMACEHVAHTGA